MPPQSIWVKMAYKINEPQQQQKQLLQNFQMTEKQKILQN